MKILTDGSMKWRGFFTGRVQIDRLRAYDRAASTLRGLTCPVSEIFAADGLPGLETFLGSAKLDRLCGEQDAVALISSVSGS